MKNIMAQSRSMADMIREVAASPVTPPEKEKEVKVVEVEEEKVQKRKGSQSSTTKPPKTPTKIDLVERLQEYKLDGETNRITYIISEKTNAVLKLLKSESGISTTDIINFLLEDSIQNNRADIDKIIKQQFNNLKF